MILPWNTTCVTEDEGEGEGDMTSTTIPVCDSFLTATVPPTVSPTATATLTPTDVDIALPDNTILSASDNH